MFFLLTGYHDTGFLTLQYLINKEFIKLKNPASDLGTGLNVSMQKMPYPPYLDDVLATVLQSNLPLFLVFSFILNTIQMAMNLAYEKEKKLKVWEWGFFLLAGAYNRSPPCTRIC